MCRSGTGETGLGETELCPWMDPLGDTGPTRDPPAQWDPPGRPRPAHSRPRPRLPPSALPPPADFSETRSLRRKRRRPRAPHRSPPHWTAEDRGSSPLGRRARGADRYWQRGAGAGALAGPPPHAARKGRARRVAAWGRTRVRYGYRVFIGQMGHGCGEKGVLEVRGTLGMRDPRSTQPGTPDPVRAGAQGLSPVDAERCWGCGR